MACPEPLKRLSFRLLNWVANLILDLTVWLVRMAWFLACGLFLLLCLAYLLLLVIHPASGATAPPQFRVSFVETDANGNLLITKHAVAVIRMPGYEPTEELLQELTPNCRESLRAAWQREGVTLVCIEEGFRPLWTGEPDEESE